MADQIEPDRLFPVIQLDRFIGARFALGQIAGKLFQMTQLPVGQGQPTVIADANDEVQPLLFEQEAQPVGPDEFTVGQQTAGVGFEISSGAAKQLFSFCGIGVARFAQGHRLQRNRYAVMEQT